MYVAAYVPAGVQLDLTRSFMSAYFHPTRPPPQDLGDARRRVVAVKALGQVVESTGCVVAPYLEYPHLLAVLLRMLHAEEPVQRREVVRLLGVLGALDPHTHKTNTASLSGRGRRSFVVNSSQTTIPAC